MPLPLAVLLVALSLCIGRGAFAQSVFFVDEDATGAADGSSWADAFPDLQQALAVADAGDEVWVAEGTYRPTDGGPDPDDRTVSFVLVDGVGLYGGFDGTEAERDERDWESHVTVLSGDIGVTESYDDNSYHVVKANGVSASAMIDGLMIELGTGAGDSTPADRGAGLLALAGSPTLRNCVFRYNVIGPPPGGFKAGGGIYVEYGSPLIEDCIFEENSANAGGAIFAFGGNPTIRRTTFRGNGAGAVALWEEANAVIENVLFEGNETAGLRTWESSPIVRRTSFRGNSCGPACGGGGAMVEGGAPLFEDCLFEGNTAVGGGAAVGARVATPAFVRTTFRNNSATGDSGGAVYLSGYDADVASPALFLNCRFERNRTFGGGGGLFAFGTALAVVNTTFLGNRADFPESGGGGVFVNTAPATAPGGGPSIVIANTVVAGNRGYEGGGLLLANVDDADVHFVNTTVAGNEALTAGGGLYTIRTGGLRIQNSIVWGNEVPDGAESSVALFHEAGEGPTVERSIVEGGCPVAVDCENILDADPLFVRPTGTDGPEDYGDLRLTEGSPGVDAGLASLLPADRWDLDGDGDTTEPLPLDLAAGPRVVGAEVDLGAYEGAVLVGTEGTPMTGEVLTLSAYPNPSRGAVTLALDVPGTDRVRVALYDVLGREVAVLHNGRLAAGSHRLSFSSTDLPAGVYVVRSTGPGGHATRLLTVVR